VSGTGRVAWRVHLGAEPARVWQMWATDAGREGFLAERSRQRGDRIELRFPNGVETTAEVLAAEAPRRLVLRYFGDRTEVVLEADPGGGTDLALGAEVAAAALDEVRTGWVSVLLALKAAVDHGVDLRNHDPGRTWSQGYVDN
jgi:uncharacterized protein YndB with AHSA1/START domain